MTNVAPAIVTKFNAVMASSFPGGIYRGAAPRVTNRPRLHFHPLENTPSSRSTDMSVTLNPVRVTYNIVAETDTQCDTLVNFVYHTLTELGSSANIRDVTCDMRDVSQSEMPDADGVIVWEGTVVLSYLVEVTR